MVSDNPFDAIDPSALGTGKAAAPPVNPFDQIDPNAMGQPASDGPSFGGAFARSAARSAIPSLTGLASIGAGAELGGAIGSLAGPVGTFVGGFVGGVGGMFAGSAAGQAAQDYGVSQLPQSWRDPIDKSAREDEEKQGTASFLGGLLPVAATMNPFGAAEKGAAKLAGNATAMQRIMASPYTARLFGGAVMGGMELGQEAVSGQPVDWQKVGMSTAFGLVFNRPNSIGQAIEGVGSRPAARAVQNVRDAVRGPTTYPRMPEEAPPAAATGTTESGIPMALAAEPEAPIPKNTMDVTSGSKTGRYVNGVLVSGEDVKPPPTIAQAHDAKVAGAGITEDVHQGSQKQNPTAEAVAQEQARLEQSLIGPAKTPDIHAVAERMAPETVNAYDEALRHRDELTRMMTDHVGTPQAEQAAVHLAEAQKHIDELEPQVAAAYRRAVDATGGETIPPAPIAEPGEAPKPVVEEPPKAVEAGQSLADQKRFIIEDFTASAIQAGADPDVARANATHLANAFAVRARRIPALGNAKDLYLREGAIVRGGKAEPPVAPTPSGESKSPQSRFKDAVDRSKAGKAETAKKEWREVGVNNRGVKVWEDQNGVRSVVESGIRMTEPVMVRPDGAISVRDRGADYQTVEAEAPKAAAPAEAAPAKETPAPGEAVTIGNKDLIVASEPHEGTQIAVGKPDENGQSTRFVVKDGEAKPLPEKVAFDVAEKAIAAMRPATENEKAQAKKDRLERERIAKAIPADRAESDRLGLTEKIADLIAKGHSIEEVPYALDADDLRDSREREEFVEHVARSLKIPIDDKAELDRWREQWLARDQPSFPLPEPEKPVQVAQVSPGFGANNRIVKADEAAALKARLKEMLRNSSSQMNSGLDPEFVTLGARLAIYYLEGGIRKFADFATTMASELETRVGALNLHLMSWYHGAEFSLEQHGYDVSEFERREDTRAELARLIREEEANGDRTAIREPAPGSLEEISAGGDEGNAGGGDSEQLRPESVETDGGRGIQSDAERVAAARSGGEGEGGLLPAAGTRRSSGGKRGGGGASARAPRGKRTQAVAEEARAGNPAFDQSAEVAEHETANVNIPASNFVLTDEMAIGRGTEGEKYADNLAAIRTLKQIEAENRRATPDEKAILARYVGWGGLKGAFKAAGSAEGEGIVKGWEKRVAELESLMTPRELRRARNSTAAAHYTSPTVVKAIWQAAKRLGFNGGSVLEPSVGTGNFFGFMPEDMRGGAKLFGAELDDLTARIAQKLYPAADILNTGFEKLPLPKNHFALAIGNPPFGKDKLTFRSNPEANGHAIHNQFFLASLDGVRPGGLFSMVVSHNLMDQLDKSARLKMAEKAEFLGAIRLPETTFKENARTQVVTDIIFLRKREEDRSQYPSNIKATAKEEKTGGASPFKDALAAVEFGESRIPDDRRRSWQFQERYRELREWVHSEERSDPSGATHDRINANEYFMQHPEMIIGKMDASGTMNPGRRAEGKGELNVKLTNPAELEARLEEAINRLPQIDPRAEVSEASLKMHDKLVQAMKLFVERAEPGRIRLDEDGGMKTVIDTDPGEGRGKSMLQEIPLTADTPFQSDYTMNADGKWQRVEDVVDEKGNLVKVMKTVEGKDVPTNRNAKRVVVYDNPADIPARHKWGADRLAKARDMLGIRDAFKRQPALEIDPEATPEKIEANRAELNRLYDAYIEKHGTLHESGNIGVATYMPDGGLILATEDHKVDNRTKVKTTKKSSIMSKRIARPPTPVERVENVHDAVAVSLGERGRIDVERIAQLLGTDEAGAEKALSEGEEPRAFHDPETGNWEPRDSYLSGLVRKKLLAAKEAGLEANIKALEKVQPEKWDASQVTPSIGSNWIPPSVYADFLRYLGYNDAQVFYNKITNTFTVSHSGEAETKWDTSLPSSYKAGEIVERLMNSNPMTVRQTDRDGKTYVLHDETEESKIKAGEIANEFLDWAFADDARRESLLDVFNDKFNGRLIRQRDGSHLTLPGKNPAILMRTHQLNAIWRGVTDPAVLFDHVVGAGKTFAAVARVIERRRMGLSQKPLVVVPNHIIEAWGSDFKALYPGSNVLVASQKDFERSNRRRLFARIAAGDYDAVVIGHSSFGFIDVDPSTEERYIEQGLQEARAGVEESKQAAIDAGLEPEGFRKAMNVREAERLVTKLEQRLDKTRNGKRDQLLTWEEMGIDDLTIDEAHEYKNLNYTSRLQNVVGMGNKNGSAKALDLNMKIRSLQERPGTAVAFLTGTPISNSAAEMYLILKNLVPKELKELGLETFDAWRTLFVDYQSEFEPTEAATLKEVQRLGRNWTNMRSLMDLYYSVADCVPIETIKENHLRETGEEIPIPKVKSLLEGEDGRLVTHETPNDPIVAETQTGGDREMVFVRPTPEQLEILGDIVARFNGLKGISDPRERNIERLKLMDQARKISLDPRAVDPRATVTSEGGKLAAVADRASAVYHRTAAEKGTQLIFLDRSVPTSKGDDRIVKAYDKAMEKLHKAQAEGDDDAEREAIDDLAEFDAGEVASLREALAGGWNAYDEIKQKLIARGVKPEEIRFVQEANNAKEKDALFDDVREGKVRILLGSTPRMGAGTNVQRLLVALHHVDVTWKPSDIEQREGRIVRQGNIRFQKTLDDGKTPNPLYDPNFAVDVVAYAAQRTIDAKMWALNSDKLKTINRIRKYDGAFTMEFEDEASASMAEAAALATGDPMMVERVTLQRDINRLEVQQRAFTRKVSGFRDSFRQAQQDVANAPAKIEASRSFADEIERQMGPVRERAAQRAIAIEGTAYHSTDEALAAAQARIDEMKGGDPKARFSIEIGGEKLTSMDAVQSAIRGAFGHADTEVSVGGKTHIDVTMAANDIAARTKGKGDNYTIDGVTVNGIPVEIDVAKSRWAIGTTGNEKRYEITFSALDAKGRQMAGYNSQDAVGVTSELGWAKIAAGLNKMRDALKPADYREAADRVARQAADAEKKIPALAEEANKEWSKEDELREKRDRLREVSHQLSQDGKTPMGDESEDGEELHQGEGDAQGKINIKPGRASIITLFEKADASTLAHELGHDYLDMLMRDAAHEAAPDEVRNDAETVMRWLKAKDGKSLTRAQHEKFADGFLQYLREGRAPSKTLATVFADFKNWLVSLYKTVTGLGKPINNDIRRVFDRMLAEDTEPTVIAPDKARGPTLAETHEADDHETPAGHPEAEARGDRVISERDRAIEDHHPEVKNVLEAEHAKIEAEQAEQQAAGAANGGTEPPGQSDAGAGGRGEVGNAGGEARAADGSGGGGEAGGEEQRGGGQPVQQGGDEGSAGPQRRPGNRQPSGSGHPNPEPVDSLGKPESEYVDKAGNIRLDNITADTPLKDVIRDVAAANDGFIGDRRGVVTDMQVVQGAYELLGRDPTFMERKQIGDSFNAEEIKAMEIVCSQSATDVHALSLKAADGGEEDVIAFARAITRHQMLQAKWSQGIAESGRATRANRKLQELWDPAAETIDQHLKGAMGRDLYQMKMLAKLFSSLGTTAQISKVADDMRKPSFGDMVLEYWINGLISGPATHATYSIGNTILSAVNAGPDTLAAAAIGALRGRDNRVRAGEVGARFRGLARGIAPGLEAAASSFQAGVTARLPTERTSFSMPFQKDVTFEAPQMREDASYRDAAASAFGILRGVRDAMLSGGALLSAGGIKDEPLWGARYNGQGAIPDFTVKGVGVLPLGTMARVPSRFIAAIHAFFRAANYSMEKSALSFRQAADEKAPDIAARVAELWQNPPDSMMRAAVKESTDLTLMGPGGEFTRKLSALINTPTFFGFRLLKFIDPFVHISSNIISKTVVERTPIGFLSSSLRADLLGENGGIAQDRAQARMLVGSAMAMGFGGLAASGFASGSGPSDPRQASMWRLAGNQAHSVRIGDVWYQVNRLGPMGMLLSISADMYEVAHLAESGDMLKAGAALQHAITQNILDESFMRGPADLIKAVEDPGRYGESYLRNFASSFVPYSVGMAQIARGMDPYTRQALTVMDAMKRKIPGASETLMARRDVWGEPMPSPDAVIHSGITAIYQTQMSTDPVNLALLALGIAPAQVPKSIRGVPLDPQQHDDFARLAGRMAKMRLDAIVRSAVFQTWPGHVRHDVIVETIKQSRETARGLLMMKNPSIMAQATKAKQDRIKQEDEDLQ